MTYKIVTSIPGSQNGIRHNLRNFLEEFMSLDAQIIEVDPIKEGYANPRSFQTAICESIRRHRYKGRITTYMRDDKVYLKKLSL